MTEQMLLDQIKQYREIGKQGNSVVLPLDDFDYLFQVIGELRRQIQRDALVIDADCICTADQHGHARNMLCRIHGNPEQRKLAALAIAKRKEIKK